ncbi:MAG: hypothetical protein J2P36_30275 [Ktedonobacteraceae bacterium]|nr:hypothetical protein [Ktedonobacteraceae bacterium]
MVELATPQEIANVHLKRFRSLLVSRASDFAYQRADGRYVRAGMALDHGHLYRHLQGRLTLGSYVMDEQGRCRWAVFDDDTPDGLTRLYELQQWLAHDGYPSYLEQSRRGGHLWLFFAEPVPASQVRSWFLPYCPSEVEFYPKQAEGSGYGSLVRLPLGVHRRSGRRYPFVQWDGTAFTPVVQGWQLAAHLDWLARVERIPVPPARLQPGSPSPEPERATHQSITHTALRFLPLSATTIDAWCAMQDPFTLIGQYVTLDQRGMACCPFGEHHADGVDQHPSLRVYEPRRLGGCCWHCYTWGKGGNVFNFLCYWYRVDARTMWQWIQEGTLQ